MKISKAHFGVANSVSPQFFLKFTLEFIKMWATNQGGLTIVTQGSELSFRVSEVNLERAM